jgi:signal transduction histidine kinase
MVLSGGWLELCVRDNGRGFADRGNSLGNGLKNMRRRAAEMGGSLEVTSQPGQGCTIRLHTPIPQMRDWKLLRARLG